MMQVTAPTGLSAATGQGWTAVELPYLGDQLALDVIMPDQGLFDAFEQALTPDVITQISAALQPQALDVRLPQFQFTTTANLQGTLSTMGLTNPFTRDADFSGVTTDEVLSLSSVAYQGYFAVSEDGTNPVADTVTAQPVSPSSTGRNTSVLFNRPFVFAVRDKATGTVLWIGRFVDPL